MLVVSFKSLPGDGGTDDHHVKLREDENREEKASQKATDSSEEEAILCAFCQQTITTQNQTLSVNGAKQHVFANPHGLVFDIGCFKNCVGVVPASAPSNEFSWFPGYSWRVAVCRYCSRHLGWKFIGERSAFFGLILEHLIFP